MRQMQWKRRESLVSYGLLISILLWYVFVSRWIATRRERMREKGRAKVFWKTVEVNFNAISCHYEIFIHRIAFYVLRCQIVVDMCHTILYSSFSFNRPYYFSLWIFRYFDGEREWEHRKPLLHDTVIIY